MAFFLGSLMLFTLFNKPLAMCAVALHFIYKTPKFMLFVCQCCNSIYFYFRAKGLPPPPVPNATYYIHNIHMKRNSHLSIIIFKVLINSTNVVIIHFKSWSYNWSCGHSWRPRSDSASLVWKQGYRSRPFLKFPASAPDKFQLRLLPLSIVIVNDYDYDHDYWS